MDADHNVLCGSDLGIIYHDTNGRLAGKFVHSRVSPSPVEI